MTLDMELEVPEYDATLRYHSTRPPDKAVVKKLCESLDLAREIVEDASAKLSYALTDPGLHPTLQAQRQDTCVPDIKIAQQAAQYHFGVGALTLEESKRIIQAWSKNLSAPSSSDAGTEDDRTTGEIIRAPAEIIMEVIKDTLEGLKGYVTLSDVLSRYWWDLYKIYGDSPQPSDNVRKALNGKFRPKSKDQPTADRSRSGYVAVRDLGLQRLRPSSFGPDMHVVTIEDDKQSAQVWDLATGKRIGKPMEHKGEVCLAQFSPDGQRVVTASHDGTVQVWDAAKGQAIGQPIQHKGGVYSVQFCPDGQRVVTASQDGTAQVWDAATGQAIGQPMQHKGGVNSVHFSPDGQRVVTASQDRTARVWNLETRQAIGKAMQHEAAVRSAQFNPDGERVVTATDETVQVWDTATGQAIGQPMRLFEDEDVFSAQFSWNGQWVVTESEFNTVQVWDAATGQAIGEPMKQDEVHYFGGIHIEFADVAEYPSLLLAMVIVHEATHKFADTEDHAYTEQNKYAGLTREQRIENADSFAYVVISITLNQLIGDLKQFLQVVPKDYQRTPKKVRSPIQKFVGEKRQRLVQ